MYLQRHILNIWIPKLFFIYLESVSQPAEISTEADFILKNLRSKVNHCRNNNMSAQIKEKKKRKLLKVVIFKDL